MIKARNTAQSAADTALIYSALAELNVTVELEFKAPLFEQATS